MKTLTESILVLILVLCLNIIASLAQSDWNLANYYGIPAKDKKTIFFDDFNDNRNNWWIGKTEKSIAKIEDGHYYIESQINRTTYMQKTIDIDLSKDFEIETRIKYVRGLTDYHNCLVWGMSSQGHSYNFCFAGKNRYYNINKYEGSYQYYVTWTKSTLVNAGGYYNKLTIRKVNYTYYFFLNGELVHTMPFQPFFGQTIGFEVAPNSVIHTDYLRVSELRKSTISSEKRLALIIGNANYTYGGLLNNPVNDARDIGSGLRGLGFEVTTYENANQREMKIAIDNFGQELKSYDVGLFFYAGHGVQVKGNNYIIPTNAKLNNENEVEYDCVPVGRVLAKMEAAGTETNIVILDACRDNPFERRWARSTRGIGLASISAPPGSLIAYATAPGEIASDGPGRNGLYTSALLQHLKTPNITILQMFQRVRETVIQKSQKSGNTQIPWESTSLRRDFYFKK